MTNRITCPELASRTTTAEAAAAIVRNGDNVGFSGFTGAGYPKVLPTALHDLMVAAHARGEDFRIGLCAARRSPTIPSWYDASG